ERPHVAQRVLAMEAVVEIEKGLPESRGAADVREDERDAELVEEVVPRGEEVRRELVARAAVDGDQHGTLAGEARRRTVEKSGDGAARGAAATARARSR